MTLQKRELTGLVVTFILVLDQVSKWWVTEKFLGFENPLSFWKWFVAFGMERRPFESVEMTSFLNFVMVWNKGISFGFFGYSGSWMVWFLTILTTAIVGFLFYMVNQAKDSYAVVAISMIIGGAIGNIWDRLRFGAVADFIDFYYQGWHYPAFNVADACITSGVVLYLIFGFIRKQEN